MSPQKFKNGTKKLLLHSCAEVLEGGGGISVKKSSQFGARQKASRRVAVGTGGHGLAPLLLTDSARRIFLAQCQSELNPPLFSGVARQSSVEVIRCAGIPQLRCIPGGWGTIQASAAFDRSPQGLDLGCWQ